MPNSEHLGSRIENFEHNINPKKILLHLGCNDLDTFNIEQIKENIGKQINRIQQKYTTATIIISTLFPRKSQSLHDGILTNLYAHYLTRIIYV